MNRLFSDIEVTAGLSSRGPASRGQRGAPKDYQGGGQRERRDRDLGDLRGRREHLAGGKRHRGLMDDLGKVTSGSVSLVSDVGTRCAPKPYSHLGYPGDLGASVRSFVALQLTLDSRSTTG